ncbi:MAG: polyphosphate kinase 1 [Spirosomataceae bacterium]
MPSFLSTTKKKIVETFEGFRTQYNQTIIQSNLISRDLSWLKFNDRVLDQAKKEELSLPERLKFMAITASNLDEFFTIRVGSLYNYLDYGKQRVDYSGLKEHTFRKVLLSQIRKFRDDRNELFKNELLPLFPANGLELISMSELTEEEMEEVMNYFDFTIYPMLTPMLYDQTHAFPILLAKSLIFAVVSDSHATHPLHPTNLDTRKLSFVQIPPNLPRFFTLRRGDSCALLPIEQIVRHQIHKLYRNIEIISVDLFRIVRNGDFTLEESDDMESDFVDEIKQKIKSRRIGRVVRMEIEDNFSPWVMDLLRSRWEIDEYNIFGNNPLIDYTCLWQIVNLPEFRQPATQKSILPIGLTRDQMNHIFEAIEERDILLHHPYNNFEPVLQLLEKAAEDPNVLSIKLTIYRLAKNSRVTAALLKAAENGKHVSALFEIKARFDEENNIREAERLQKAGCFVIYGIGWFKTHTKLMLIVRKEGNRVVQYAHMASGNYNEDTSRLYTDIGLLTTNPDYTRDISEFFNVITGHSQPAHYQHLITSPRDMRRRLIEMIQREAQHAQEGLPSGICFKINSLEDREIIEELYKASQAGVPIQLIVRGICCLRPGRKGLSENIRVISIVGAYLEHARILCFRNVNQPVVYGGSADLMVRSFDKRIESMFELIDPEVIAQMLQILAYNLRDNVNSYVLQENGEYIRYVDNEPAFNIHEAFYHVHEIPSVSINELFSLKRGPEADAGSNTSSAPES